jgi:hypothetical protein
MPNISLRIPFDSAVGALHELEARPRCNGDRCSVSVLGRDTLLCLSPILTPGEVPSQGPLGQHTGAGVDCTFMADSALASNNVYQRPGDASTDPRPVGQSQGGVPSPSAPAITQASRVVSIRKSLAVGGISEIASDLILASWRSTTEKAYSCC